MVWNLLPNGCQFTFGTYENGFNLVQKNHAYHFNVSTSWTAKKILLSIIIEMFLTSWKYECFLPQTHAKGIKSKQIDKMCTKDVVGRSWTVDIPNPAKNAQFDSKNSSLLFRLTAKKFHLYLENAYVQHNRTMEVTLQMHMHWKIIVGRMLNNVQTYILEAVVSIHQWQEQEVHCLAKVRDISNHWNLHAIRWNYMKTVSDKPKRKTGEVKFKWIESVEFHVPLHHGSVESYLNKENGQKKDRIDLFPYTKCNPNIQISVSEHAIRHHPVPHEHTYLSNPSGWSSASVMLWAFNARVESRLLLFTTSKACLAMSLYLT